eukprot:356698-Chlamydomonas_euryale.AAC.8
MCITDVLRHALGLGADKALHVVHDGEVQPLGVARVLAAVAAREGTGLAMLGKQAIDDDANQTVCGRRRGWRPKNPSQAVHGGRRRVDAGRLRFANCNAAASTAGLYP